MVKVSSLRLAGFDPALFFGKLGEHEKSAAYFTSGAWTIVAWNPIRSFVGSDVKVLKQARKFMPRFRRKTDLPFTGGLLGWVSYDAGLACHGLMSRHPKRTSIPDICAHLYVQALLTDGRRIIVVGDTAFRAQVREIHARSVMDRAPSMIEWKTQMSQGKYREAFRRVKHAITEGDVYQLNLTHTLRARSTYPARTLFQSLLLHHPAPAAVYLEHGDTAVLSASPERFVLIENGVITTCPVKGTRSRGDTPVRDRQQVAALLSSEKEQAELNMITDLLRNDVGKIAQIGSVRVRGHRLLQKNPSVWHTYSVVEGLLKKDVHPLDAFLSMFPGGSVTGCPKVSAMQEIDTLELHRRELYCGSAFLLSSSGRFDSTILIRTMVRDGKNLSLGVGGGVVADSSAQDEYEETQRKAARILSLPVSRIWLDGKLSSAHLRPTLLDPAAPGTRGVFETMHAEGGKIQHFSLHWKRLRNAARVSGFGARKIRKVRTYLHRALAQIPHDIHRVKIVVTDNHIVIETRPYVQDPLDRLGIVVSITNLVRPHPHLKALPYHREWGAYRSAKLQGNGETLLRSPDGTLPEASISNLFFVKRGILHTPKKGMLPGVTRAVVLSLARDLHIPVHFATPTLRDLRSADEVFLTRSLAGIVPIVRIESGVIGSGKPGPVTRRLLKAFSVRIPSHS